jgi:hypothetical protein
MKNFGLLILGIIIGAIAMYFYGQLGDSAPEVMEPTAPKGLITPQQITSLTKAYDARYDTINATVFRGVDGGDNRSSWYALEDVRNYLDIAEQEAKDLKYTMNGVRLYLGANPIVGDTPGYTTLLFVPTGTPNTSEGTMFNFNLQKGPKDIPGGPGLDHGENGVPPSANYPQ